MGLLANAIASCWRRAIADIGGDIIAWRYPPFGLEARVSFGIGKNTRYFLARWYPADGVLCQGRKEDILRFQEACARAGFRFQLKDLSLCG